MKRKTPGTAKLGAGSKPVTINVTIETPRGSRKKLKYEPAKKMYSLSKILPEGMVFPYDVDFVPGTKAQDGDPLDVLVLTDEPLFPGCLVACTLVGVAQLGEPSRRRVGLERAKALSSRMPRCPHGPRVTRTTGCE
jgi:inorganic pyrophosphatase